MSKRVSLFVTCIVDQVFPQVGIAIAEVLERLGYQVDFPQPKPAAASPHSIRVTPTRRANRPSLLNVFRDSEYIIVPSGSCTSMIAHHFADIFQHDPSCSPRPMPSQPRVWEFSRFLLEVAGVDDVGARFNGVVTYHDSCHALRELRIKSGPRTLLQKFKGLTLAEMDAAEECCGFGGTFSIKFPEVSGAMARTKIDSIQKTGRINSRIHRFQLPDAIARRDRSRRPAHPNATSG